MTIDDAIKKNPFDPNKGNQAAYCRYLRYNVEGWYNLDSKEVLRRWKGGGIEYDKRSSNGSTM